MNNIDGIAIVIVIALLVWLMVLKWWRAAASLHLGLSRIIPAYFVSLFAVFFAVILRRATCLSYAARTPPHPCAIGKSYLLAPRPHQGEWPSDIAPAQSLSGLYIVSPGTPSD
jgi:hypothetical protein